MKQTFTFHVSAASSPFVKRISEILQQRIHERCDINLTEVAGGGQLILDLKPGIGAEGYQIEQRGDQLCITGNDERGLLYGVGRFLRTSRYTAGQFTPSDWRGRSVPDCHVRGMYFAFHNNFYPNAPQAELVRYIEDLALWGLNSLLFHFAPKSTNAALATPDDVASYKPLLYEAKLLGIRVGLIAEANIGRDDAPQEIRAADFPDTDPPRRGYAGVRICPSHPQGFSYLSKMLDEYLAGYEDIGLDYVVGFPYDSGGCGCKDCWPWGARGYVKMCKEFSLLARQRYPQCKFVLGTWCFDVQDESDGEYEGLAKALTEDKSWVDFIMSDSHYEFPAYPLQQGVPGGLPLINFAEISMWGRFPWGGYGANPLPDRFQYIWDQSGYALDGGFPYSEGKYEDLNKFIFSQFFWNRKTTALQAVREYIAWEYSPDMVEQLTEAIYLLEQNYPRKTSSSQLIDAKREGWTREGVDRAFEIIQAADQMLPAYARQSWRWRIVYLRALIDFELIHNHNLATDRCDAAYEELIRISYLQTGWKCVTPPSRAYRSRELASNHQPANLPPGSAPDHSLPLPKNNAPLSNSGLS